MRLTEGLQRRFWGRWRLDAETGCWLWTGTRGKSGYGRLKHEGGRYRAHRVAYELFIGPIPDGMQVNHHCDVRHCVCPAHLYAGTHWDNMRDAVERDRFNRSGANGFRNAGMANGHARLTDIEVAAIMADPRLHREIAADYGVDRSHIGKIKRGRKWRSVARRVLADMDQDSGEYGRG